MWMPISIMAPPPDSGILYSQSTEFVHAVMPAKHPNVGDVPDHTVVNGLASELHHRVVAQVEPEREDAPRFLGGRDDGCRSLDSIGERLFTQHVDAARESRDAQLPVHMVWRRQR